MQGALRASCTCMTRPSSSWSDHRCRCSRGGTSSFSTVERHGGLCARKGWLPRTAPTIRCIACCNLPRPCTIGLLVTLCTQQLHIFLCARIASRSVDAQTHTSTHLWMHSLPVCNKTNFRIFLSIAVLVTLRPHTLYVPFYKNFQNLQ